MSGLEEIVVSRQIPAIHILLSLDEINPKSLGYQSPNSTTSSFWLGASAKEKPPKQKTDYAYNRNNRNFTKNNRDKNPPNSSGGGKKPRPEKEKKTNSENGNKKQKPDPVDPK
jgi:ribonuclease P/MRP protein subunit RPP25